MIIVVVYNAAGEILRVVKISDPRNIPLQANEAAGERWTIAPAGNDVSDLTDCVDPETGAILSKP